MEQTIVASRGRNRDNPSDRTPGNEVEQRLEENSQGICNTLTTVQKDNMVLIKNATKQGYIECPIGGVADFSYPNSTTRRGRVQDMGNTSPTITATETGVCKVESRYVIRKLTPRECWRLMGFTDLDFFTAMFLDRERAKWLLKKAKDEEWTDLQTMEEARIYQVTSDSHLYEQAGNSIVKQVLMWQFKKIIPEERRTGKAIL
jgi:site-specific DNA-cytosine methylase